MEALNSIRIWLCDCGRIHAETKNYRVSFTSTEFLALLRSSADAVSAGITSSQQPRLTKEACELGNLDSRADQRLPLQQAA